MQVKVDVSPKMRDFFYDGDSFCDKYRFYVAHGGRGSGKSFETAQLLVLKALKNKELILCTRELQKSIKDSSLKIIKNTIETMGVQNYFETGESFVRCQNGSEFIFKGLRHNAEEIKSTEGITQAWVEEAENTSEESMRLLVPTIRTDNSKIYITFNPKDKNSHIYKKYVIEAHRDPRIKVTQVNYYDNPHFPQVLEDERLACLATDSEAIYKHIWLGECLDISDACYYSHSIHFLHQNNMVTDVPYMPTHPVQTYWDIGYSDYTSIWFIQIINGNIRVIDFEQNNGEHPAYYAELLNSKGYHYDTHYLPHDAKQQRMGMTRTIASQLWDAGLKGRVSYTKKSRGISDIQATRNFIKRCFFDYKKAALGIDMLKNYRRKYNQDLKKYDDQPLHDWASHASDAFLYLAMHNLNTVDMIPNMGINDKMSVLNTRSKITVRTNDVSFV